MSYPFIDPSMERSVWQPDFAPKMAFGWSRTRTRSASERRARSAVSECIRRCDQNHENCEYSTWRDEQNYAPHTRFRHGVGGASAHGAAWPTNCREGAAVRSTQRYLILGLAMATRPIHDRRRGAPGGGRLHLQRWVHRMCAGRGPRCGRGAEGRDSVRPLSVRERLVLRQRLGSRLELGSGFPV